MRADEDGVERHDGPTPSGGAYSTGIRDRDGVLLEIYEHAADDMVIARIYPDQPRRESG